jgi:hypothetical protein
LFNVSKKAKGDKFDPYRVSIFAAAPPCSSDRNGNPTGVYELNAGLWTALNNNYASLLSSGGAISLSSEVACPENGHPQTWYQGIKPHARIIDASRKAWKIIELEKLKRKEASRETETGEEAYDWSGDDESDAAAEVAVAY